MPSPPPPAPARFGGGVFITLGVLGGVAVGILLGEPSAGLVTGIALGLVLAAVTWLLERRHSARLARSGELAPDPNDPADQHDVLER